MATKKSLKFEDIFDKVKKEFGGADVSNYEDHLAFQVNITGEGEGAFYAEIKDHALDIQPYDYNDRDFSITAAGTDLVDIFAGKLDIQKALEEGKLQVEGNFDKAFSIVPVIENNKNAAKKTSAAKKTTAAASKKTAAKAASKEVKDTAKKATKTAAAKTTAAKKASGTAKKG